MIKVQKSDIRDLIISGTPDFDASFYAGELRMIQFPSHNFALGTSDDQFTDFAAKTLRLAIENLLMHQVLTCASEKTETTFFFLFRHRETADYFTCSEPAAGQKHFGYLEQKIMAVVRKRPGCSREDLVYGLIDAILGYERYPNPGKEIVKKIIDANTLDQWTYNDSVIFFRKKVNVTMDEAQRDAMVTALNKISRPVIVERNHNKAFWLMSERLLAEIGKQLDDKEDRDYGG